MFPQQPQQQFRTAGADVKLFYSNSTWTKPPGVSNVYMMLIGPGGSGDGLGTGGGSGAVTVWYGAAQNVPDSLGVSIGVRDSSPTQIYYILSYALLTANYGSFGTPGTSSVATPFANTGFYKSTAGTAYGGGASGTTFLSGGGGTSGSPVDGNYGYSSTGSSHGIFQLQPIIVAVSDTADAAGGNAPIGCGGGNFTFGGPGMVLIASW